MPLSEDQFERYTRHVLLRDVGEAGQERLLAAAVAVQVGRDSAAEIAAIVYLAAAGVGRILLGGAVGDPVTRPEVAAGLIYGVEDAGRSRFDAIRARVTAINPDVRVSVEQSGDSPDARLPPISGARDIDVAAALVQGGAAATRVLADLIRTSTPRPVLIPRPLLRELFGAARRAFPAECCGWLSGPRDQPGTVDRARLCANAQETGLHPTRASRSAETAYLLATEDLLALNHSFDSAEPARVIFHSHPNGRAYFSPTDREIAASPWADGPAYPVQHLVVGIDSERVVAAALFAWSDGDEQFVEVARYPGEDI